MKPYKLVAIIIVLVGICLYQAFQLYYYAAATLLQSQANGESIAANGVHILEIKNLCEQYNQRNLLQDYGNDQSGS